MPSTPRLGLPYPDLGATPDVPYWTQQLAESLDAALGDPPRVVATNTAPQNVPASTWAAITLNTQTMDSHGMHDPGSSRLTATVAGLYVVNATIMWSGAAGGYRLAAIRRNNVAVSPNTTEIGSATTAQTCRVEMDVLLAVGDYLEMFGWQNSGAPLTTATAGGAYSVFRARWVAAS